MIDGFVNIIGGYDSWGFAVAVVISLFVPAFLGKKYPWLFLLTLFGAILLLGLVTHSTDIAKEANPDNAGWFKWLPVWLPVLFVVFVLAGVWWGLSKHEKKDTDNITEERK